MAFNDNKLTHDENDHARQNDTDKPTVTRIYDDNNLEEKDLKRSGLFGSGKMKDVNDPGMEGQGMGGENFGKNNLTPAGDDQDNPSQNAGYTNAYFRRNEPSEEHPENSNFVAAHQQGGPGKEEVNIPGPNELPDQQKVGEDDGNQTPNPQKDYQEGTADEDGEQTKKTENTKVDNSKQDAEKDHIEN